MFKSVMLSTACTIALLCGVALGQSDHVQRTLVINGQRGIATVYRVGGKSLVDLQTLVQISNGSVTFQGNTIILSIPGPQDKVSPETPPDNQAGDLALSADFMRNSLASLGAIKQWINVLTYAAQRGVPGDGTRIVVIQDRATEALLEAKALATSPGEHNALELLTNDYNTMKAWSDKLVGERRSMDTGKYSLSPDLIDRDETYQKIQACTKYLGEMLPTGRFQDDRSCH